MKFLEAVARMEGFNVKGLRPSRNHNPGDLGDGPFARAHGATGSDGRFAIFPDAATGFAAMRALFIAHYHGLTIQQTVGKYAPCCENDDTRYVQNLCAWTGLTPATVIDGHLG